MELAPMKRTFLATLLLLLGTIAAPAAALYQVTIDTTSLTGTSGFLNFQVGVLGTTDPLSIVLSDFLFDGALNPAEKDLCLGESPCPISGEIGTDPSVTFENTPNNPPAFIDYLQPVVFGSQISFRLFFSGLALDNPSQATGSTSFEIVLFDDDFRPVLSDDPSIGSIVSFLVEDGDLSFTNFSTNGEADVSEVPEPGTLALVGLGLLAAWRRKALWARA
jgi:hypothetical protein